MMQDIKPGNIGIRIDKGTGLLFDLEGLARMDSKQVAPMVTEGYKSPELLSALAGEDHLPLLSEKEMVYQLGVCLRDVFSRFSMKSSRSIQEVFDSTIENMTSKQDDRENLEWALRQLDELILLLRSDELQK